MTDPNSPAHPCRPSEAHKGLTIRQAYAMAAMQGLNSLPYVKGKDSVLMSKIAFTQADAMIAFENAEAARTEGEKRS